MEKSILSASGRIRRTTFWSRWLIIFVINIALTVLQGTTREQGIIIITGLVSLVLAIFMIIQGVKRMHDVNKSGWYIIVPIYNIILAFTDGTPGINEYGDDPKGRMKKCSNCHTQNETNASICSNCGATLANIQQSESDNKTGDTLLLIYIIIQFTFGLFTQLWQMLDKEWYTGYTKYILGAVWILSNLSLILLGMANRNKSYRIVGIILTSIMAIGYIYLNIKFMLK
jgi:uncharacterized membrane protein YhaH (DUF805 family)